MTDFRTPKDHRCHLWFKRCFHNGCNHLGCGRCMLRRLEHHSVSRCDGTHERPKGEDDRKVPWRDDERLAFGFWQHMRSCSQQGKRGAHGFWGHPASQVPSSVHDLCLEWVNLLQVNFFSRFSHVQMQCVNQSRFMGQHGVPKRGEHCSSLRCRDVIGQRGFLLVEDVANVVHERGSEGHKLRSMTANLFNRCSREWR